MVDLCTLNLHGLEMGSVWPLASVEGWVEWYIIIYADEISWNLVHISCWSWRVLYAIHLNLSGGDMRMMQC